MTSGLLVPISTKKKQPSILEVQRAVKPNRMAMLEALRVVLDLPRKPIVLKEDEEPSTGQAS